MGLVAVGVVAGIMPEPRKVSAVQRNLDSQATPARTDFASIPQQRENHSYLATLIENLGVSTTAAEVVFWVTD